MEPSSSWDFPPVVRRAFAAASEQAKAALERGAQGKGQPWLEIYQVSFAIGGFFAAVQPSMPLPVPIIDHAPSEHGSQDGRKNIVGLGQMGRGGRRCVVYGVGIGFNSDFEQRMSQQGCETHAFDCSVGNSNPALTRVNFTFHPWCIGHRKQGEVVWGFNGSGHRGEFRTLGDTMRRLNHTHLDLLKFDIEGYEWNLIETELLAQESLPEQLSFELHTEGANHFAVQPRLVMGKKYRAVSKLFLDLHDRGYRVVSKEINPVDNRCAEFVLVNVNPRKNASQ